MTNQSTPNNGAQPRQYFNVSTLLRVSKWYRFDWNSAISVSRLTSFASIATILSISAFVLNEDNLASFGKFGQMALLAAVGCYLFAFVMIKTFAPRFLQEYAHYKAYADQNHSHRWIVWSFIHNFESLHGGARIAEETITKGLSDTPAQLFNATPPVLPDQDTQERIFSRIRARKPLKEGGLIKSDVTIYQPESYKRDIYLGIEIHTGARAAPGKYVLSMREADTKLDQKVKELFWIIISEAAKHRTFRRWVAWIALGAAAFCTAVFIMFVFLSAIEAVQNPPKEKEEDPCACKCEIYQAATPALACEVPLDPNESLEAGTEENGG